MASVSTMLRRQPKDRVSTVISRSGEQLRRERAFRDQGDRTGHQHVIVGPPLHEQVAARQADRGLTADHPQREAATTVAQAAVPQASVSPAPRSQTLSLIASRR